MSEPVRHLSRPPEVLASGLGWTEGPVWLGDGTIACTSVSGGAVYRIGSAPEPEKIPTGGGPNGLTMGPDGALYVAQNGGLWGGSPAPAGIQRIDGSDVTYITTIDDGAPNDICVGPDGRLWFTDPRRDGDPYDPRQRVGRLWSCAMDGGDLRLELDGLAYGNGLAFDPGRGLFYLTETAPTRVLVATWGPGGLGTPRVLATLETGRPDGLALDADGNLWVAATSADGLVVISPDGRIVTTTPTGAGSRPSNCCFGGENLSALYVTAAGAGQVIRIQTTTTGQKTF